MKPAIICDLDGTLYDSSGRKHYVSGKEKNYHKFHEASSFDLPHRWCVEILTRFQNDHEILYVSGREDRYRDLTLDWLYKFSLTPPGRVEHLYMRKSGDYRKDCVVKKEIYEAEIKGKYDVLFVLDDRKQVVDMWRAEGLTVLHCAEGDF